MGQGPSYNRTSTKTCKTIINATPREVRDRLLHLKGVSEWGSAYIKGIELTFPGMSPTHDIKGVEYESPRVDAILKIFLADGETYFVTVKANTPTTLSWEGAPDEILDAPFRLLGRHTFTFKPIEGDRTEFEQVLIYDERYHKGPKYGCTDKQWLFIQNEDTVKMKRFNEELKKKVEDAKAEDTAFWKNVNANR